MPHIEYPLGYVFIGRRHELTSAMAKRLRRLNYEYRSSLEIHSLDWFTSAARSVVDFIGQRGSGNWALPMRALTQRDLAQGLPPLAQEYMQVFSQDPSAARDFYTFIEQRQWRYEDSGGADGEDFI
jgi:hypothetical protein